MRRVIGVFSLVVVTALFIGTYFISGGFGWKEVQSKEICIAAIEKKEFSFRVFGKFLISPKEYYMLENGDFTQTGNNLLRRACFEDDADCYYNGHDFDNCLDVEKRYKDCMSAYPFGIKYCTTLLISTDS